MQLANCRHSYIQARTIIHVSKIVTYTKEILKILYIQPFNFKKKYNKNNLREIKLKTV